MDWRRRGRISACSFPLSPTVRSWARRIWTAAGASGWRETPTAWPISKPPRSRRVLPPSEDLAVARFKMGDAFLAQNDFTNALENYRAVLEDFANFPAVAGVLGDRALYQSLRANLDLTNLEGASDALEKILKQFPASDLAPDSALLYGEGLAAASRPAAARAVFQQFLAQFPGSPLRPEVEFAIARTYELEQDWPDAIAGYQGWLEDFPDQRFASAGGLRAGAGQFPGWKRNERVRTVHQFRRAVSGQPATDAAGAMVAGRLFLQPRRGQLRGRGEKLRTRLPEFSDERPCLSGAHDGGPRRRSAAGLQGRHRDYFSTLEADTNCPTDLRVQAAFAHGDALMWMNSTVTNDPLHNFSVATNEFASIIQLNPTNEAAARAWGKIGDCYLQLSSYDAATNAYAQVLSTNVQADSFVAQPGASWHRDGAGKKGGARLRRRPKRFAQAGPGKLPRCVRHAGWRKNSGPVLGAEGRPGGGAAGGIFAGMAPGAPLLPRPDQRLAFAPVRPGK